MGNELIGALIYLFGLCMGFLMGQQYERNDKGGRNK